MTLVAGMPAAGDVLSGAPVLGSPLACNLSNDCYIQKYMDHDLGRGAKDYRCATLSQNGHTGTDFALRSIAQMRKGVKVLATAPGVVKALRAGVEDVLYSAANAEKVTGRECGNGVVLDHGGGWETQYCHLKKGSIRVKRGQTVRRGTELGQVGLSGRSQFPHVHLTVRKDGKNVDPFDPDGVITCGKAPRKTMWAKPFPYHPGGLIDIGFAQAIPTFSQVQSGRGALTTMPADAPAIVVFGYAFGARKGDKMRLVLRGPGGVLVDRTEKIKRTQAQLFRAAGKRSGGGDWPKGTYRGDVVFSRGGVEIDRKSARIRVR